MAKYRVAVIGTVGKSVLIDDSLSSRVAKLETQIATTGGVTRHSALTGLRQGDDHPQYTMWAAPETIKALWNFQTIPYIQGEPLAEYIEDVVAGGSDPFISDSPSITWTYDDTGNHLQADVVDEYVEDLVGSMLVNTTYIDLDYGDSDGSIKAILDTGAVLDLVGTAAFQDSSTIDFTYDSGTKRTSAAVICANPSGLIGMSAVNGTAATPLRSDGRHAIDPAIAPTWTGRHTYTNASAALTLQNDTGVLSFKNTAGTFVGQIGTVKSILGAGSVTDFAFLGNGTNFSFIASSGRTLFNLATAAITVGNATDLTPLRLANDSQEFQLGASQDLRLYHDGTNSIVRTDTGGLRLQFSTNNRFEVNTTGVGFNGATPIARPDYTVTNPTTNRSIDVSAITHAQLAQVVGTMIQDFIDYGLYQ